MSPMLQDENREPDNKRRELNESLYKRLAPYIYDLVKILVLAFTAWQFITSSFESVRLELAKIGEKIENIVEDNRKQDKKIEDLDSENKSLYKEYDLKKK